MSYDISMASQAAHFKTKLHLIVEQVQHTRSSIFQQAMYPKLHISEHC